MFTAKVGQMDYRQSLKQVKKFELEDKEIEKVNFVEFDIFIGFNFVLIFFCSSIGET